MGDYIKSRWDRGRMFGKIKSGIFVSLATCFMLCIFAPLELYLSNPGEFWYDAYVLFPFCLGTFGALIMISLVGFIVAWFCGEKIYNGALALYFAFFAAFYVQGNFDVKGLPPFDGTDVYWVLYRKEMILSTVCWCVIVAAAFVLLFFLKTEKFRKMVATVSLLIFGMLFITLTVLGIGGDLFAEKEFSKFTKNDQFEMSTDQNFVILLLDAIDEDCFWQIWEQHPEYQEAMADFTFYNNALTGYPYTDFALPLMISGEWYENQEPFEDYQTRIFHDAPLFDLLRQNGFSISFYDAELQFELGSMDDVYENLSNAKFSLWDPKLFWKRQIKMVGVKYAPWVLKPYCWFDPEKLWHQCMPAKGDTLFVWENKHFYDDVNSREISYADGRKFKLIHLMGAHVPFYYDQYVNEVDDADYFSCIESSMTVTMAYLEKLKSAGVYDNSIIMILSDHGYNYSGVAAKIPQRNEDSTGRQHPILFVKGLQEKHEMQISGAPVSFEDLMGAYDKLLQGASSDNVFEYQEGDYRERRYFLYKFMGEEHMEEHLQTGYAGDESSLIPTGRVYDRK